MPASLASSRRVSRSASNSGSPTGLAAPRRARRRRSRLGGTTICDLGLALEDRLRAPARTRARRNRLARRLPRACNARATGLISAGFLAVDDPEHATGARCPVIDCGRRLAGQDALDIADAEALPGAEDRGEEFPRGLGRVDHGGRVEAIVAIAALSRRILAEMAEQDGAAATGASRPARPAHSAARARPAGVRPRPRRSAGAPCAKSSAPQNRCATAGSPSRPARPVSW